MSLKSKFFLMCGVTITLMISIALLALYGSQHFTAELTDTARIAKAIRNHTLGDMVHDGLRSDVYAALMSKELGTQKADVLKDFKEKSKLFNKVMGENRKLDLPSKAKQAIANVNAPLNEYVKSAEDLIQKAFSNRSDALAALKDFNKKFSDLEGFLEEAGDKIEAVALEINQEAKSFGTIAAWASWTAVILAVLTNAGFLYFVVLNVTRPMWEIDQVMAKLSNGQNTIEIPYLARKDEIGSMASSIEIFRENALEREKLEQVSKEAQKIKQERQENIDLLITSFREKAISNLDHVRNNTNQMEIAAKKVAEVANKTSAQANSASEASTVASQNVQAVSAAADQLSQSIGEISHQISVTSDTVEKAATVTETTDKRVTELSNAAQKIGDVLAMISDIAEQTNLLALNATIEAARAGESGRGFAVVASEVKSLATQTAKATEDIASQISNIQVETEAAVSAIREISEITVEVNKNTAAIASAVEKQNVSTSEISTNVQSAAMGSSTVTTNISGVTAVVGETTESAIQMLNAVQDVSERNDELRLVVDSFLKNVAAA